MSGSRTGTLPLDLNCLCLMSQASKRVKNNQFVILHNLTTSRQKVFLITQFDLHTY